MMRPLLFSSLFVALATAPSAAAPAAWRLAVAPLAEDPRNDYGYAVAFAGDVNGDGHDDFIVGAPFNDRGGVDAGRAYVYFGGPAADAAPDWVLTGEAARDQFGWSVAAAGDVNGDGFDDVIVGAPINRAGGAEAGRAYVFLGGPNPDSAPDLVLTGEAAGDRLGWSVAGVGDTDGDGFDDVLIGAPLHSSLAPIAGRVYLVRGGAVPDAVPDWVLDGEAREDQFGFSVAAAGDTDGDGRDDFVVGGYLHDGPGGGDAGRAYLFRGASSPPAAEDLIFDGEAGGDQFGYAVSSAGDFDGDGFADVAVGAPRNTAGGFQAGRVYVYFGGPGADNVADRVLDAESAGDFFGGAVARGGDVDRDGYADLVVGAHLQDFSGVLSGRAYVVHGGPAPNARTHFDGEAAQDVFGWAVGGGGDFAGDGFPDVLVGAFLNDAAGPEGGRAYLFDFNRYHLIEPDGGEIWKANTERVVRWLGAEPARIELSLDGGASFSPLAFVAQPGDTIVATVTAPAAPTRRARVRVVPADPAVAGADTSTGDFVIAQPVVLDALDAKLTADGVRVVWSTRPPAGQAPIVSYELRRVREGAPAAVWSARTEAQLLDPEGALGDLYELSAVEIDGDVLPLGEVRVTRSGAGLEIWPSPARGGAVRLAFPVAGVERGATPADLRVEIFDARGRRVLRRVPGAQRVWNGHASFRLELVSDAGRRLASGTYLVRLQLGETAAVARLVIAE